MRFWVTLNSQKLHSKSSKRGDTVWQNHFWRLPGHQNWPRGDFLSILDSQRATFWLPKLTFWLPKLTFRHPKLTFRHPRLTFRHPTPNIATPTPYKSVIVMYLTSYNYVILITMFNYFWELNIWWSIAWRSAASVHNHYKMNVIVLTVIGANLTPTMYYYCSAIINRVTWFGLTSILQLIINSINLQ